MCVNNAGFAEDAKVDLGRRTTKAGEACLASAEDRKDSIE
jgi:hypothetical protein